jgi:hypothetical protein
MIRYLEGDITGVIIEVPIGDKVAVVVPIVVIQVNIRGMKRPIGTQAEAPQRRTH